MPADSESKAGLWNCPSCNSRNGRLDIKYYHCGKKQPTEFAPPPEELELHRQRLAMGLRMGGFSKFTLYVGMFSSLLGVFLLTVRSFESFHRGQIMDGVIEGPIQALSLLALFVTFRRILQLS